MGDKKRKKLSVARFVATANESFAEPRGSLRFRIIRVADEEGEDPEEVTATEVRTSIGRYKLQELLEATGDWDTIGECSQEGETTGRVDRDQAMMRETSRLNDSWSLHVMSIMRDRDEWKQLWKDSQKDLSALRVELAETEEQNAKLIMDQSEAGAEWVELVKMGIDRLSFANFMTEARKRINRLAPGMTKEQALCIQTLFNSPEFQMSDEDLQASRALDSGNGVAEPAEH